MNVVGTRKMVLEISGTDYSDAVSTAKISSAEKNTDFVTFAVARAGGAREYTLELTTAQDTDATSLFQLVWGSAGTDVPFVLWPHGKPVSGTATVSQPKYTGTATVAEPDGDLLGGDADKSSTAVMTTDLKWVCLAKPVKATS